MFFFDLLQNEKHIFDFIYQKTHNKVNQNATINT